MLWSKNTNPLKCNDFRLITLMNHTVKIFLKIIHKRINKRCEAVLSNDQFGFRAGLGTREALFTLQTLIQKCHDQRKQNVSFIDFNEILRQSQSHQTTTNTKRYRKKHQKQIRIEHLSKIIQINSWVRQGPVLSTLLVDLYSKGIFSAFLVNHLNVYRTA